MNKVSIIAPTKADGIFQRSLAELKVKRVAAYARVSTESDEQANSFENQVEEWTRRILENPNYKLVKIYADEGISGTSIRGREGFQEMISDAKAGKIDLILVKSISRFARNTVLTIQTIRELKECGVEVYFDNENIWTFDPKTEFMLSIISMMAQEESRHISENVTWTFRKMMNEGKTFIASSNFLGYDYDKEREGLVINKEQAPIVKLIYDLYDQGVGTLEICRTLKARGYKTVTGKEDWHASTVIGILKNEKYVGDLLLQKTYTVDYLTHKRRDNTGQRQKYYVKDAHEAIIPRDQWERVQIKVNNQALKAMGGHRDLNRYNVRYPLSGTLICLECGETYKRRHWYNGYEDIGGKIMYQCGGYVYDYKNEKHCKVSRGISENLLHHTIADAINNVYLKDKSVFRKISTLIRKGLSVTSIDENINAKQEEKEKISKDIDFILKERMNAGRTDIKEKLDSQYAELVQQYQRICSEIKTLQDRERDNLDSETRLNKMLSILDGKQITADMITLDLLEAFIYRIIVVDRKNIVITINAFNSLSLEDLRAQRKEVAKREPLYQNKVRIRNPKRFAELNYKIVLV